MSEVLSTFLWWLVIQAFGLLALPLAYRVLRWLPDRGYTLSKALGVLFSSYLFWLLNSLGFLRNSTGSILLAVAGVLAFSLWIYRRGRGEADDHGLRAWLRAHLRLILTAETLFLLAFAGWALFRAHNPEITGTEKPMDLAFINAVGRSDRFPPLDPWLSGFAISYYYFGYLIVRRPLPNSAQSPGRSPSTWASRGSSPPHFSARSASHITWSRPSARGVEPEGPIGYGVLGGVLASAVMGNLEGFLEVLHANAILPAAFWQWLDIQDLNTVSPGSTGWPPRFWWWWRASRVITDLDLTGSPSASSPLTSFRSLAFCWVTCIPTS